MFRYLAGLVLVQLVTLGLFVLNADAEPRTLALQVGLPTLAVALLAALWFRSLARADAERDLARTRLEHERERERLAREAERERADLTLAAERERADVARAAERTIRREERRIGRRASWQVGLAFAATSGMGVLFVLTELVTLGLLTLTAGGSALGGYVLRWRQTRPRRPMPAPDAARVERGESALVVLGPGGRGDATVVGGTPSAERSGATPASTPSSADPGVRALPGPTGANADPADSGPGRRRARAAPGRAGV